MPRKLFTLKNKRHMPRGLAWLFALLVKLIAATYRVRIDAPETLLRQLETQPVVGAIWHNRLLFIAAFIPKRIRSRYAVLISRSRDGEYVSIFIRFFGLAVVRGSSSKGGTTALLELIRAVQNGSSVVLTVDGPRGPRYTVHPGAAAIATHCHVPLLPVAVNAPRKWQLRSWDQLQIPAPFSKVTLAFGQPFTPDPDATPQDTSDELRRRLLAITED